MFIRNDTEFGALPIHVTPEERRALLTRVPDHDAEPPATWHDTPSAPLIIRHFDLSAADRRDARDRMERTSPHKVNSLGALQAEQHGDYDTPRRRIWWGPSDIGAEQADELARAQTQYDADVQEGVDGAFSTLAWGAAVVGAALLLLHLALTYWPPGVTQ